MSLPNADINDFSKPYWRNGGSPNTKYFFYYGKIIDGVRHDFYRISHNHQQVDYIRARWKGLCVKEHYTYTIRSSVLAYSNRKDLSPLEEELREFAEEIIEEDRK